MIYKRLIGCIIVRGGIAVQSFGFRKYLPVGKPEIVAESLCRWGVDEIILLDIDATPSNQGPNYKLVEKVAERIFTPLTVGGGVKSLGHFKALLNAGADKIALNSIAIKEPTLITKAAESFGKQCIIASIDTYEANGECTVWSRFEDLRNHFMPVEHLAIQMEQCGAGEILLNCITRNTVYQFLKHIYLHEASQSAKGVILIIAIHHLMKKVVSLKLMKLSLIVLDQLN